MSKFKVGDKVQLKVGFVDLDNADKALMVAWLKAHGHDEFPAMKAPYGTSLMVKENEDGTAEFIPNVFHPEYSQKTEKQ